MPDEVILAELYGSVLADAKVPCVIVQFHRFANRDEFIHIMETGLAYFEAHVTEEQPWGWIGDVRHMGAIPQAVQDWLTTTWNSRAFNAGVREVSIVAAENVLGKLATQQYVRNTTSRKDQYEIATATYPSVEAAKQGAREAFLL